MKKAKKSDSANDNSSSLEVDAAGLVKGRLDKKTAERIARMSDRQRAAYAAEAAECMKRLALGYTFRCNAVWIFQGQESLFDREAICKAFMGRSDK